MTITMLHAKIHNARVTARHLNYHGSLTIDLDIIEAAGMRVGQQIQVYNANNGARFETYILRGERGTKEFQVNGPASRLCEIGDTIVVCTFAQVTEEEASKMNPKVVVCNAKNEVVETISYNYK